MRSFAFILIRGAAPGQHGKALDFGAKRFRLCAAPGSDDRGMNFDFETYHADVARLRRHRIFFIGGAMKSGTTWLQLLLDQHPEISCGGEGHFPSYLIPLIVKTVDEYNEQIAWKNESIFSETPGYPQLLDEHRTYLWASAVAFQLGEQLKRKAAPVVGEKTPDNVRFFRLLHAVFPTARCIHIVRDGRDCAVSGWFHNLRVTPDWMRETFPTFDSYAQSFAQQWVLDVGEGTRFGAEHPDRYLMIRYEDLHREPATTLARVCRILGVSDLPDIMERCCSGASFERLSGGRAPGQEDPASFFRKGETGDWRQHFSPEARDLFNEKAGAWLRQFGYGE